jgi:XTP/dITP diphosphohydrolase
MKKHYFFASKNQEKLRDVLDIVGFWSELKVEHYDVAVAELQTNDVRALIQHKLIEAFERIRQPTIVDHTCLSLSALNGLPGAQASLFWDKLGGDICEVVNRLGDNKAQVEVWLGYTDGKRFNEIVIEKTGTIASSPRGGRKFDWDSIFIPSGEHRTYAEMTPTEKNKHSPRAQAFNRFYYEVLKNGKAGKYD